MVPTAAPIPQTSLLRHDEGGAIRIGQTRVSLDTVIGAHQQGCGAEEISRRYPSLTSAEAQAVIAFFHQHQEEVEAYLSARREEAELIRRKLQEQRPPEETLRRVRAPCRSAGAFHAPAACRRGLRLRHRPRGPSDPALA